MAERLVNVARKGPPVLRQAFIRQLTRTCWYVPTVPLWSVKHFSTSLTPCFIQRGQTSDRRLYATLTLKYRAVFKMSNYKNLFLTLETIAFHDIIS